MSTNRENVIWKSEDGKWYRGFYDFFQTGEDYEWDVEYNYSEFNWISGPHLTKEAAEDSWDGSNPGGWSVTEDPRHTKELDRLFSEAKERFRKQRESDEPNWQIRILP